MRRRLSAVSQGWGTEWISARAAPRVRAGPGASSTSTTGARSVDGPAASLTDAALRLEEALVFRGFFSASSIDCLLMLWPKDADHARNRPAKSNVEPSPDKGA